MKRFLIPLAAGVFVFGSVTAFAASLSLTGTSLGSGSATVSSCNTTATVTYNTTLGASGAYKVSTTPITSASACGTLAYRVTLIGSGNTSLGEQTGTLASDGTATPDFSSSSIAAASVTGVAVVITG